MPSNVTDPVGGDALAPQQQWPDAATLEANAAGGLTAQQQRALAGRRIGPPYLAPGAVRAALPAGALAWWAVELGLGTGVALLVAGMGLAALGMNLAERGERRGLRADVKREVIGDGPGLVVAVQGGAPLIRAGEGGEGGEGGEAELGPGPGGAWPAPKVRRR